MTKLKLFATNHPVYFSLLTVVAYFLVGGLFVGLAALISGVPYSDPLLQSIGALCAISVLLGVAWRFEWWRPMGFSYLGKWWVWPVALALLIYIVLGYWLVFFGDVGLDISSISSSEEARTIFWRQLVVGFTEEILFRGIILYALMRVWGGTRSGLYLTVLLSAVLFGIPHILQAFSEQSLSIALLVIVEAIISGIWYAAFVLLSGTLWPIVLIHAFSNMAVALKALTDSGWALSTNGLLAASLIQLPLVLLGLWLLQRRGARLTVPFVP